MPTVMITGANRGLGLEFTRQYLEQGWQVFAACRDPDSAKELNSLSDGRDQLRLVRLDVSDSGDMDRVAASIADEAIDVLINNAGIFGPKKKADNDLRQTFGHLDDQVCMDVFRVNSVAPLMMAQTFLSNILAGDQKKIVTITSTAGSIAQSDGGIYAYRMSKAAVNMAMANLASDLAEQGVFIGIINPGWVRTDMGGAEAALAPAESIRAMRRVIADLDPKKSGAYLDYDGQPLPW